MKSKKTEDEIAEARKRLVEAISKNFSEEVLEKLRKEIKNLERLKNFQK